MDDHQTALALDAPDDEKAARRARFKARREARAERLRARAERRRTEGAERIRSADQRAAVIPFGQPILVGHYSEGRDRRYRDKIHRDLGKGFAAIEEAKVLERRADAAEDNRAISSDDPDAVDKLREKLAAIEANRAAWRAINKAVRAKDPRAALAKLGVSDARASALLTPDCVGRIGIEDFRLSNAAKECARLRARIELLTRKEAEGSMEPVTFGQVRVEHSHEDNRVRLYFPDKPPPEVRKELKREGFRWSPSEGAWQRHASAYAWQRALYLGEKHGKG